MTTSNLTWRFGIPPPPGADTVTAAIAVWPVHTAVVPQSVRFGVTVSEFSSGAGRTVTAAVAVLLSASRTLTVTVVSTVTLAANSGIDPPLTAWVTGNTA